ncbi:MAG: glycosyltransferase family 4 protein, partial [Deltaproteobacteria bacterium]|nr:glycosyltransferase family 4 protein [Deltaproteobacteria bacterium]
GYYQEILKNIAANGLSSRIHFVGHVPWHEMPRKYSSAVCTLIPTVDCEGTSLSALESMACGTPVIATNVGGLKDLPCVHCPSDAEAIKNALLKVLGEREAYAVEQEKIVRQTFNQENWGAAWKRVLAKLSL